jgi:DNA-binding Lrp family transcriptional regulator
MKKKVNGLKESELKLIGELLENSCRSDRELAKALGTSQPTVSRIKAKLNKEGYISEYTVIPNFNKIGYHIFALTFFTWKKGISTLEMEEARKYALEKSSSVPNNIVLIERGVGLGFDSFMASFHRDYTSYAKLVEEMKTSPYLDVSKMESFLVNLDDKIHYRYLTFSTLAKHLLEMDKKPQEPGWKG